MAATISLELLTPQKVAAQIDVSEATLPGSLGQFTVLPDHAPYVAQLKPGVLRYTSGEGVQSAVVIGSGFAEVVDNRLLVLTRRVDEQSELNGAALREELAAATRRLDETDPEAATYAALGEEVQRLRASLELLSH